jgi:hypothetical protein
MARKTASRMAVFVAAKWAAIQEVRNSATSMNF